VPFHLCELFYLKPRLYEDYTYHQGIIEAVKKGITDNSWVGGSHLTPAVGTFDVKLLNGLIVKVIKEELGKWPLGQ
jgi:hypothetical protein